MRLGPDMYHLNTFYLHKNGRGNVWADGGHIQKTRKKCHEIHSLHFNITQKQSEKRFEGRGFSTAILHRLT